MKYDEVDKFDKDMKKLLKRYKTLLDDFEVFKKYALEPYFEQNVNTNAFVKIEGMCNRKYDVYKVRKFACKALKNYGNQSGIRIIFIYDKEEKIIRWIEIYYKGDKENEDRERIKENIQ